MANNKKPPLSRLKTNEPDEILTFPARLLEFGQKYLTTILIGITVGILAAGIWGYLQKRQTDRLEKAAELFQAVVGQQKTDATTMLKELQTIIQDYPETGGALQARLLTANLLYQEKKYEEAAAAFQALGEKAPDLKILVAENLSYCFEAQKDYQKAAGVLDPLIESAELPYRQELQRRQALLFEAAGDRERALALYQKMAQENPPENFMPYLQEKIKVLGAGKK